MYGNMKRRVKKIFVSTLIQVKQVGVIHETNVNFFSNSNKYPIFC